MERPKVIDGDRDFGSARRTVCALLPVIVVLSATPFSVSAVQSRPDPWPQPGDTEVGMTRIEDSMPLDVGAQTPFVFGADEEFATIVPRGDTTTYTRFNSWDIPPGDSALPDSGEPSTRNPYLVRHSLNDACPGPSNPFGPVPLPSPECATGGAIRGKTYGALRFRVGITPDVTVRLDTLHYKATWALSYPTTASFAPGDTIRIGADYSIDPGAALVAEGQLDSATLTLQPILDPFFAELTMEVCVLGVCRSALRSESGPISGPRLIVTRDFPDNEIAEIGVIGKVRLPRIQLTDSWVEEGRRIGASGFDTYADLNWDLSQFLCGGCLSGTLTILRATLRYLLLDHQLHTLLRTYSEFTVEPLAEVTLDFGETQMEYVIENESGEIVEAGTDTEVSFAPGNSIGLIMPADTLEIRPSIEVRVDSLGYEFEHITDSLSRSVEALRVGYTIPPTRVGRRRFAGASFQLGPAHRADTVIRDSTSEVHDGVLDLTERDEPLRKTRALPPFWLAPELPSTTTQFGDATRGVAASGGAREGLMQAVRVENSGNVHLEDVRVGYQVWSSSTAMVVAEDREIVTRRYLEMFELIDFDVPLELDPGRAYQLKVAVHANSPIGTAISTTADLAIALYDLDIGLPTSDTLVPLVVHSSDELEVGDIAPASVRLAGLPAVDWRFEATDEGESLVLQFPREELVEAARATLGASAGLTSADLVHDLLAEARMLTEAQIALIDRLGNRNARLDIGDVRAFLLATGELPATGAGAGPGPTPPPTLVPATLLFTAEMSNDRRGYGVGRMFVRSEGP